MWGWEWLGFEEVGPDVALEFWVEEVPAVDGAAEGQ